jgi:ElaB/YqjD/DUF883 family membrane-anchored ribosome-binding protein
MTNIDQAKHAARDVAQQAQDLAEDTYRRYQPEIERYGTQFTNIVREKPIQSLAVAGAFAFIIGALWRR